MAQGTDRQTGAYICQVDNHQKGSREQLVTIRSKQGEEIAYNTLSDKALRIYLLVTSNKKGFRLTMSSTQIGGKPLPQNMSRSSFTRAIKDLQEHGFLTRADDGTNLWVFHDYPVAVEEEMEVIVDKRDFEAEWYSDPSKIHAKTL